MTKQPTKFKDMDALAKALEGENATMRGGSRTLESGDFEVKTEEIYLGIREIREHIVHHCPECDGYFIGRAPINKNNQRYCEVCKNLL